MKEEISDLIYDFAYISGDGGTTVNPEAVDELTDKIIKIIRNTKCKNCEIISNGSIIKVNTNSECIFCFRKVGGLL